MKYPIFKNTAILILIFTISACQSEYTKLVKSELSSGKKNDTIFYNLRFGNTKSEFFKICWDLNKKEFITNGPSNNYVKALVNPKDSTKELKDIQMLYYGVFDSTDIMTAVDVKFSYIGWAPWTKHLQADKLLPVVQDTLLKWFPGNPFMKVKNVLVKVDGNRQIKLYQESDRDVAVLIEDLEYKYKTLKK